MNRVITSLIAILSITGVQAQRQDAVPKLVITITVDQLRGDYLQYFSSTFGERGFKRLLNEGLVYHRLSYDYPNVSRSSAIATLQTGTYPYYHGIVADKKYDFERKREVSILYDPAFLGNYTSENISPKALLSSTIGDELKIASGGRSDVYAIAPEATEAIISAGNLASAAFWMEDYNGKWATTTYFKNIPWYVDKYNSTDAIGNRTETATWSPAISQYTAFPYTKNTQPFRYDFAKTDKDRYLKLKQSPLINTEVTNLAARFFEFADFGKRANPDMLALTYYAGNYANVTDEYGQEIQDTYYRLDKEIERLLDLIEQKVGLKNVLVVLTSTGYYESKSALPEGVKPAGEFFPNRCTALLNMYLMAIHGQGSWVDFYYNNQIYLNKKLIEERKIDMETILRQSADFILQFSGVQDVTTSKELFFEEQAEGRRAIRKGIYKKISGDLFLELQPGWNVVDEQQKGKNIENIRNNAVISPLIFFGSNILKQSVYRPVKATEIAPTITHVLRIRPPNACKEIPLQEFLNYK